jgi:maltose alpha-D-glucosyltransferase/alpha-amylase
LSLELVYVTEEDRKYIHDNYCHKPEWDFRKGQGISARLSELMERNPRKMALIYSLMLTLPGTPVIYYGDEFGKYNDENYYREQIKVTGKDDTRFLVRGKIDWEQLEKELSDRESFPATIFEALSRQISVRKKFKAFGRGGIEWVDVSGRNGEKPQEIMAYFRSYGDERIFIVKNLSPEPYFISWPLKEEVPGKDLLGQEIEVSGNLIKIDGYGYHWLLLKRQNSKTT